MRCPKCKKPIYLEHRDTSRRFVCENHHSYDIAKEGYVNLLLKNSQNHGDNKAMVRSRSHFLNQDYYLPLAKRLIALVHETQPTASSLLDLGCGQGYYTEKFQQAFADASLTGIDISKEAIAYAAKQNKAIQYVVASNADLPLADESIDVAFCLFSFIDYVEVHRVLKTNGILIVVNPHERHLFALKEAIYETPYLNEVKIDHPRGFSLTGHEELTYPFVLSSLDAIKELFGMTPYAYKTSKEDAGKLNQLDHLEVSASFSILIYQKINV